MYMRVNLTKWKYGVALEFPGQKGHKILTI